MRKLKHYSLRGKQRGETNWDEDHTDENNDKKAAVDQSSAGAEDTTTGAKRRKIEIEDHDSDMKD